MVSAAFAEGGAGAGLGTQRALQAQKPERGVWGKGGLWGDGGRWEEASISLLSSQTGLGSGAKARPMLPSGV